MTTLDEVLSDLRRETAVLDELLASLDEDAWSMPTPAEGWDVRDTVGHLAATDDAMYESVTAGWPPPSMSTEGIRGVDDVTALQVERARKMSVRDVHAWWRSATARLADHIGGLDRKGRYPWGGNQLTPLSLCSARMMETWAHSLDCHAAAGKELPQTDRLRHVAHLGLRSLPYAFGVAGLEGPGPVRLELTAPNGELWTFGPDDAPTVVRGSAFDWCSVAAHRDRDGAKKRLDADGPDGQNILEHARAFL
jgi:uncharacterized protein (TIGR03084 family)